MATLNLHYSQSVSEDQSQSGNPYECIRTENNTIIDWDFDARAVVDKSTYQTGHCSGNPPDLTYDYPGVNNPEIFDQFVVPAAGPGADAAQQGVPVGRYALLFHQGNGYVGYREGNQLRAETPQVQNVAPNGTLGIATIGAASTFAELPITARVWGSLNGEPAVELTDHAPGENKRFHTFGNLAPGSYYYEIQVDDGQNSLTGSFAITNPAKVTVTTTREALSGTPGRAFFEVTPKSPTTELTASVYGTVPGLEGRTLFTNRNLNSGAAQANAWVHELPSVPVGSYAYTIEVEDGQPPLTGSFTILKETNTQYNCLLKYEGMTQQPPALGKATGKLTVKLSGATGWANLTLRQDGDLVQQGPYNITPASGSAVAEVTLEGLHAGLYTLEVVLQDHPNCFIPKGSDVILLEVQPPDLEIGDQLTFLPWVQSELAAAAATGGSGRPELLLSTQLRTSADTGRARTQLNEVAVGPAAAAQLYGAGDVLGVSLRAILGTTPVPGARGASALQLAAIEFQEEDLPWRYSTRRAQDANRTPAPWLFLLVLKAGEYERRAPAGTPLPTLLVKNPAVYPDPDARQQAQWAHVQLNARLGPKPDPLATTALPPEPADITKFLRETLPAQPALAYSRVFCPRRLEADTPYHAFLLPATEAGRLAGLGLLAAPDDASAASFPTSATAANTFPIYFEWEFETGAAADFEDLAQQLHQANDSTKAAVPATLGLAVGGTTYALPMPALLFDAEGALPAATPVPYPVADDLWQRLAPTFTADLPTPVRPLVAPPLYGRAYMLNTTLGAPADPGNVVSPPPVISPSWKHQINLDPRYRALAAAGAQVVQANQEEYVRRAWDQVQDILLANDKLRGAQYGLRTTAGLRDQHLPLLTTTTTAAAGTGARLSRAAAEGDQAQATAHPEALASYAARAEDEPASPASFAEASPASLGEAAGPATTAITLADYGLHLTALSLSRIRVQPASPTDQAPRPTLREAIRQSSTPLAAFSPAFRRINNPYGKYQGAQAGRPRRATQAPPPAVADVDLTLPAALTTPGTSLRQRDGLFGHLTTGAIGAAAPRADEVRTNQFDDDVVDGLLRRVGAAPDTALTPGPASPLAGEAVARFQQAYQRLRDDVPRRPAPAPNYDPDNTDEQGTRILGFRKVQHARQPLDLATLKADVIRGTQPGPVFTVRVQQVAPHLPAPALPGQGDFEAPDFNATHFYVGDFDEPAPALPADWLDDDFSPADFNVGPYVAFNEDPAPTTPGSAARVASRAAAEASAAEASAAKNAADDQAAASLKAEISTSLAPTTTIGAAPVIHTDAALPAIKQAKVFPVFKDAMGEALRQRYPELFVPGLGEFPQGGLAVLDVNQAFIEAYMVGLNHALGSELRWRGFPVEPRATFFQQFWDVSEHVNSLLDPVTEAAAGADLERRLLDIKPLDQWVGTELGTNGIDQADFSRRPLRLALRSELLRRYPGLVIGLQPSAPHPTTGLAEPDPDPDRLLLPRQRLAVGQDMAIVTFDVELAKATAAAVGGLGAYYLVLLERPGQPRFGLDAGPATTTAPLGWDDLSWGYLGTQPGENIAFDFGKLPHATAEPKATEYLTDSAVLAYALFQEPILLAVPVRGLLA